MLCLMFFVAVLPLKNYSVFIPGDRSNLSFTFQIWDKLLKKSSSLIQNQQIAWIMKKKLLRENLLLCFFGQNQQLI